MKFNLKYILLAYIIIFHSNLYSSQKLSETRNKQTDLVLLNAIENNNEIEALRYINYSNANDVEVRNNDYLYYSALMIAIDKANLKIVKKLIEYGANVNYIPKTVVIEFKTGASYSPGRMPLQMAAENGNLNIVKLLLENSAAIDGIHKDLMYSPIFLATHAQKLEVVKYLVSKGASLSNKDENGNFIGSRYTLIQLAIMFKDKVMLKYFIEIGAPLEVVPQGNTIILSPEPLKIVGNKEGYNDLIEFVKKEGDSEMLDLIQIAIKKLKK